MLSAQSVLFVMSFATSAYADRILIIYPTPSYSHQLPAMGLTEALVKKGHQVFALTTKAVPGLEQNYTFVDFSWLYKSLFEHIERKKVHLQQVLSKWKLIAFFEAYQEGGRIMFESDTFKQFHRRVKDEGLTFDVVIVESFFIPFGVAVARLLTGNKPVVTLATMTGGDYYGEASIGNILHPSYSPALLNPCTDKLSLWERIDNWFTHHYLGWRLKQVMENGARAFVRDNFGPDAEALVENCWANVSLSIIASNALYYYPRAITPNVIEVGCLHINTPEKLPKILQNWLDGAEHGVIYFSLGGNMESKCLPDGAISNFLKVFGELPKGYRVLWKWENDTIPWQSDNILTQKWLPQQSVLAHPKVKMFIMQGGCQSFQETVHYGVPTVGIPWFGDQRANVAKMVDAGIGVLLRPHELSSYEAVKSAVEAVLFDERYLKNMRALSELTQDFTSRAREEAVFWVEHVAKHGGASHFRPQTAETSYFQFFCLDILSVLLILSISILYILVSIIRYFISIMFLSSSEKVKRS